MKDKWVKRWEVEGSNGNVWIVGLDENGNYGCSCPRWKFKREECHHIERIKASGGNEIVLRTARPGNVPEVTIDGDTVLYPLVPFGGTADLPATIVYDLQRANVDPAEVKDYAQRMFPRESMKRIMAHVKARGRLVYSKWQKGQGWMNPVFTDCNAPLRTLQEIQEAE